MELVNILNDKQTVRDTLIGKNVVLRDFINLYECSIGDGTAIGTFVEIQKNVTIGKRCKIQSHTFICEGVTIKNEVFVGHNVSFINDKIPRAVTRKGEIQTEKDWGVLKTEICDGVSIGTSATILGGITIGKNSVIGAGAVVTRDIPPNVVVAGNPARIMREI